MAVEDSGIIKIHHATSDNEDDEQRKAFSSGDWAVKSTFPYKIIAKQFGFLLFYIQFTYYYVQYEVYGWKNLCFIKFSSLVILDLVKSAA